MKTQPEALYVEHSVKVQFDIFHLPFGHEEFK